MVPRGHIVLLQTRNLDQVVRLIMNWVQNKFKNRSLHGSYCRGQCCIARCQAGKSVMAGIESSIGLRFLALCSAVNKS